MPSLTRRPAFGRRHPSRMPRNSRVGINALYATFGFVLTAVAILLYLGLSGDTAPVETSRGTAPSSSERDVSERIDSQETTILQTQPNLGIDTPDLADQLAQLEPKEIDLRISNLLPELSSLDPNEVIKAAKLLEDLARHSAYARDELRRRLESTWMIGELSGTAEIAILLARLDDEAVMSMTGPP